MVVTLGGLEDGEGFLVREDGLVKAGEGEVGVADADVDGRNVNVLAVGDEGH